MGEGSSEDDFGLMFLEAQRGLGTIKELRSKGFKTESPEVQLQELRRAIKQSRKMLKMVEEYPLIGSQVKPLKKQLDTAEKKLKEAMRDRVV
jgi:hypothetical protein